MLYEIDYEYDKRMLLQEARVKDGYEPFVDPKNGSVIQKWLIKRDVTGYGAVLTDTFKSLLDVDIKPRFYIQEKGFTLPYHRDRGTTCAINFVLSSIADPITFRQGFNTFHFKYKTAIVDVTQEHMVTAMTSDRYLFKMSIFDKSYEEILEAYDKTR